ncbi:MAG: hypothetical protein KAI66_23495 [Lentisphaeria bacterium]|nr:hypothetical protein [Lentisphaeria bacterium]
MIGAAALLSDAAAQVAMRSWETEYRGDAATGEHVLALWQFHKDDPARDSSSHGHTLRLRGRSRIVDGGRFGSCLECFASGLKNDVEEGAATAEKPEGLTPTGAFTMEMWIKPKPEFAQCKRAQLVDKMYIAYKHKYAECRRDYRLRLWNGKDGRTTIVALLGFDDSVMSYSSSPVELKSGRWYHLAFTYDGAGTGCLYLDGTSVARKTYENQHALAAGTRALVVGDRWGSTHRGFSGFIDQFRITNRVERFASGEVNVNMSSVRSVFERMEKNRAMAVEVHNDTGAALAGVTVVATFAGQQRAFPVGNLSDNARREVQVPLDTTVRAGTYDLDVSVVVDGDSRAVLRTPITIASRALPERMPVVLWGEAHDVKLLAALGFTHHHVRLADYARVWEAGKPTQSVDDGKRAELLRALDDLLRHGLSGKVYAYPGRWLGAYTPKKLKLRERFKRVSRSGELTGLVDGNLPEVQQFCYNLGASIAQTFGDHPALRAALIDSEVRDSTRVSFREESRKAFRDFAGIDIPPEILGTKADKRGLDYRKLPGFPANRILPDDDPLLVFYRWFWGNGDAWGTLHTKVHNGLKSTGRDDLWTFYDPAVRVPSIWGSGGGVDVLGQWTYSYPDPIKIGQATDELLAMADGGSVQQAIKGTQIIWYRKWTTKSLEDEAKIAPWERDHQSGASYITIAPDHLREAFWCKIARPIKGISYHGWSSLVKVGDNSKAYRFTHPGAQRVLAELVRDVVQPLGPVLRAVPDRPADVALLESFTSQMFAGRGCWGWSNGREAQMHMILQYAQLQPRVVYEQTIERDGLDQYKVLVMPCCDVLPRSLYEKIADWQRRGGILVADQDLAPALTPDIVIPLMDRSARADEGKAQLLDAAQRLRRELDPSYQRYGESSVPDVIVRSRRWDGTDYVFAINDKRTFGEYVGHHGLVMEKGLPQSATITIRRPGGHVYDLVAHQSVKTVAIPDGLTINASFGAGGGRLFMITARPVDAVRIETPASAERGKQLVVDVSVVDDAGEPIDAVVPVRVELLDPQNRPAEFSGFHAAVGGKMTVRFDVARNDLRGKWTVVASELASGKTLRRNVIVR